MSQADGVQTIAPRVLIIPNITNNSYTANATDGYISGQIAISGQSLVVWMGAWTYISGAGFAALN